jgi:SNF2 family DNA or RNA helicase
VKKYETRALGIELFNHQIETMNFILANPKCFVFDEIGTGKTISLLETIDLLLFCKKISQVLVIAPISVMKSVWVQHILQYYPHRTFSVLHASKKRRLELLKEDTRIHIINPDGIKVIHDELMAKKYDMIVIDESTVFAAHTSDRTKAAWQLCRPAKSVVCMTGEPTPNDLLQSYSQAKLVHFENPKFFTRFRDKIKTRFDEFTYFDKPNAVRDVHEILQPAIRHSQKDCLDLPPCSVETLDIELTSEQKKLYKDMEKEYLAFLNDKTVTAANAAVKVTKLMQISAGLLIDNSGEGIEVNHKSRLVELMRIFDQLERKKLIVFANFTMSVNTLVTSFAGIAKKIDGSVKPNDRVKIIEEFQHGDLEVLIGQPKAISHGVNLQTGNNLVWWSPVLSNETYNQCNGRIRRAGQTRPQRIFRLQSTRIERYIYSLLERKQKVSQNLLKFM